MQPLGSFKIRAAANMLASLDPAIASSGVATASAGNFAQGLALAGRNRGITVTVHAPDTAAQVKVHAMRALGARVMVHSFEAWWSIMTSRETGADDGLFIHPVCEPEVILGNGTIALELVEDWPEIDTVVIPFGGGGLTTGIALALRSLGRKVRIVACEIETSTPLASAMRAGRPIEVSRTASFVDGIGSNSVLTEMWPLVSDLVDDVVVISTEEARAALQALVLRSHIVPEGAGAVALAAAISPRCGGSNVAAVISGGNIDPSVLSDILKGA